MSLDTQGQGERMPDNEFVARIRSRVYAITGPQIPQGDGASVPFAGLPFVWAIPFTSFKSYLDARFPDAFRLHDFLYSQVAAATGISRAEADAALFIELLDDPVSAIVVYAAVRVGGQVHFRPVAELAMPPMWLRDP